MALAANNCNAKMAVNSAMDLTKLATPYGTSSYTTANVIASGAPPTSYFLADKSTGTTGDILPYPDTTSAGSLLKPVHMVMTATLHSTDAGSMKDFFMSIEDFSWWILPE